MRSASSMLSSVLVTLASLSFFSTVIAQNMSFSDWQQYNSAWHMDYIDKLADERLDPIVNPNGVSGHLHQIIGGSRFHAAYSGSEYKNAGCTTCPIKADKSNYWMPKLFWINNGGTSFTPISGGQRFYYFLQQSSPVEKVSPFPDGLRILVGDPNRKTANTFSFSFTCQVNPPPYQGSIRSDNFNFGRDCPNGMKVETHFPQCWDGVNLYKADGSHMSYPVGTSYRVGNCPWTHPIRIPQIMTEFTYYTSTWAPGKPLSGNLAWANGDSTGFGVHADFVNGWTGDVLARALNDSRCTTGDEMAIEQCPVMAPEYDYAASRASNCQPEKGIMQESPAITDNVPIPRLPGCNPLWNGQGTKPGCPAGDYTPNIAPFRGNDGGLIANPTRNFVPPTTPGWKEIACIREGSQMLKDQIEFYDDSISQTTCENTCHKNGFNYAAIGLTQGKWWKCLCGTGVQDQAQLWPQMCTQPCPGNSTQTCGGDFSGYSVYYAPPGTTQIGTNSSYFGCYQNPSPVSAGLEGKATYSFSTNTMMTQEMCFQACADRGLGWAAIRSGQNCFCGADKDFDLGAGKYVSDASCNMNCTGNKQQVCGFWTGSSVFNVTALGYAKKDSGMPAGYQGCYNLPSGKGVANAYTYWDNALVPERCTLGCLELGYQYAEVDTGRICNCGNTLTLGNSQPPSFCQTACFGNSSQTCGGSYNGDLYFTNSSLPRLDALKASKKAGWIGCFDNSKAGGFKDWSRSNAQAQTIERCQISCQELGYKWAGLQNGDTCKCSNTAPSTQINQTPTSLSCNAPCKGNSSETCGGTGGMIEAYDMSKYTGGTNNTAAVPGYVGCYQQNSGPGLKGATYYDNALTIQMCTSMCKETKMSMAGLSGNQCTCGNTWEGGNVLASLSCKTPCPGNSTQVCGESFIASVYNSSIGVVPTVPTAGYVGCYTDNSNRTLPAYSYSSRDGMTPAACEATCAGRGYKLAGVQNGGECYCDNVLQGIGKQVPSSQCGVACSGNSALTCGASWRLSVYDTGSTGNSTAPAQAGRSIGCYQDFNTLDGANYYSDYMSANLCLPWCKAKGFAFGGMSGRQCRCGNTSPGIVSARATCNVPCSGNSTQTCGSTSGYGDVWSTATVFANNANPYTTPDSKGYMGCWTDGASRLLTGTVFYSNTMTPAVCAASCAGSKYTFAGIQNGNECRCGNTIDPKTNYYRTGENECSKACTGDASLKCGGGYRYNIYATKEFLAAPQTGNNGTNSTTPVAKPEGLLGCYGRGTFASSSAVQTVSGNGMTTGFCRRYCRMKGFSTAGLMGGNTCFCGSQNTLASAVSDAGCSTACTGNSTSACGGDITLSVYNTNGAGALTVPGYPADYVGCYVDGTPRLISGYSTRTNSATPAQCKTVCDAQGYPVYGLENGNECYCGTLSSTDIVPDNQCSTNCAGDANQKCGGWYRMSIFGKLTSATTSSSSAAASSSSSSSRSSSSSSSSRASSSSSSSRASSASTAAPSSASSSRSVSASASATTVSPSASSASSSASDDVTDSTIPSMSGTSSSASVTITSSSTVPSTSDSLPVSSASSEPIASSSVSSAPVSESASTSSVEPTSSSSAAASSSSSPSSASESTSESTSSTSSTSASASSAVSSSPSSSSQAESSSATVIPSSSSEPIPSSSVSASATTSSSAAPSPVPTDASLVGCFASTTVFSNANMTCDATSPRMCKIWCNAMNFQYAAVHDGDYCGCSNEIAGLNQVDISQCNTPCIADGTKTCGGQSTFEVFEAAPLGRARRDLGLNARGRAKAWVRKSSE